MDDMAEPPNPNGEWLARHENIPFLHTLSLEKAGDSSKEQQPWEHFYAVIDANTFSFQGELNSWGWAVGSFWLDGGAAFLFRLVSDKAYEIEIKCREIPENKKKAVLGPTRPLAKPSFLPDGTQRTDEIFILAKDQGNQITGFPLIGTSSSVMFSVVVSEKDYEFSIKCREYTDEIDQQGSTWYQEVMERNKDPKVLEYIVQQYQKSQVELKNMTKKHSSTEMQLCEMREAHKKTLEALIKSPEDLENLKQLNRELAEKLAKEKEDST